MLAVVFVCENYSQTNSHFHFLPARRTQLTPKLPHSAMRTPTAATPSPGTSSTASQVSAPRSISIERVHFLFIEERDAMRRINLYAISWNIYISGFSTNQRSNCLKV